MPIDYYIADKKLYVHMWGMHDDIEEHLPKEDALELAEYIFANADKLK